MIELINRIFAFHEKICIFVRTGLVLTNIEALAQNEGGDNGSSNTVVCYSTYNNCWFWDCSTIYRCNVSNCQTVSADDYSDDGRCSKR